MPVAPIDQLVRDARDAFEAGVQAVHPTALMAQGGSHAGQRYIEDADCVRVATIGKAAVPWGDWWAARGIAKSGLIVAPAGYGTADRNALPDGWHQVEAGHPHPTKESAQAGRRLLEMAERCGPDDVLVVGLSGGGSACTAYPPAPISMAAVRRLNELLLHSGLPIGAVNAVRKHVLRVGGGRLAAAAHPGRVWCQAISDVPGDDLSTIASGPTVGDPTTYADAIAALHKAAVWDDVPRVVRTHLQEGARGRHPESIAPGDERLRHAHTAVIASNNDAQTASASHLADIGYAVHVADTLMEGEARAVGCAHAEQLLDADAGTAWVWGGEPTVHVTGSGTGGRNQEAALAAVQTLAQSDTPVALFCAGTDGIDGPTDAAGAWATSATFADARSRGADPDAYLAENDSYPFFKQVDGLYQPGSTGTNVMDLHIGLKAD